MPMKRRLAPALAPLAALALACFTGEDALYLPCVEDGECGKGQICLAGHCGLPGTEPCGNGIVDNGEECDDGEANADDAACTAACTKARCGDGKVGPGEACDGGAACTPECLAIVFADDMQSGAGGWKHAVVDDPGCLGPSHCFPDLWSLSSAVPTVPPHPSGNDGQRAWFSGDLDTVRGPGSSRLRSPELDLSDAAPPIELSFTHLYAFKQRVDPPNYYVDGAILEVSVDGGPFEPLPSGLYNGVINDAGLCSNLPMSPTNPLLGRDAYVGVATSWQRDRVALDAYAGHTVELGFRVASDCANTLVSEAGGDSQVLWYIDDVRVTAGRAE